jgi:hypothetical protein
MRCTAFAGNVVYLRDVLRERREQQERFTSEPTTPPAAAAASIRS